MARVIYIVNPQVSPNEDNGEHILYVSGKNSCVSEGYSKYTLLFSPFAKLTRSGKSIKWDELQKKIKDGLPPNLNRSNQVALFYGFRREDSCSVEIRFYDDTMIYIEDKEILGLPETKD